MSGHLTPTLQAYVSVSDLPRRRSPGKNCRAKSLPMWSQRLPESLQSSCEHCHKNRVPWTGCHCSEGCALCTGSPGTTYGNSVKHHLPHPRDVLLGAHFRGNVSDGKDGAAESREVTGQPPQPLVPGCGFATLELPQPWTPPAVSVSVADLHSNNSLGAPFSQASEPGISPPRPHARTGKPLLCCPSCVTWMLL